MPIVLTVLGIVLVLAAAVWVVALVRWARNNSDPLHHLEDPETGDSEADWMRAIR